MLLMALARGRTARTGESCRHAPNEIRLLQPGTPLVRPGADVHPAALESDFLEVIDRCPKDRWRPRMRPFGIKSVTRARTRQAAPLWQYGKVPGTDS